MKENTIKTNSMKNIHKLSFGEEIGNSVTHGVMAALLLILLPYVAIKAYLKGGTLLAVAESIFVISLFLMFLSSTLYHSMAYDTRHKYIFRILDHIFIYVAIAGTYTPIALYSLNGWFGYLVVILQWAMVLFGILYKSLAKQSIPKVSLSIYLIMGWMAVILIPELLKSTSPLFIGLIALGGILYSVGAWFYAKKRPYDHMIWHVFINLASISHFIAIVFVM